MDMDIEDIQYGICVVDPTKYDQKKNGIAVMHFIGFHDEPTGYDYIMTFRELTQLPIFQEMYSDGRLLLIPAPPQAVEDFKQSARLGEAQMDITNYSDVTGTLQ